MGRACNMDEVKRNALENCKEIQKEGDTKKTRFLSGWKILKNI
jgi:hypothetical protein